MQKKRAILLLGLIIILIGWWFIARNGSTAHPEEGFLDEFVATFTPYMAPLHPLLAGRGLSYQQSQRAAPLKNNQTPEAGFYETRVAMMIDKNYFNPRGLELQVDDIQDNRFACV